jgi:hypothetical protein
MCHYSNCYVILSSLATIPGIGAKWHGHIHSIGNDLLKMLLHFLVTRHYSDCYVILSSLATIPGIGAKWRGHVHSVPSRSDGDLESIRWSCGKSKSSLLCLIVVNVIENILDKVSSLWSRSDFCQKISPVLMSADMCKSRLIHGN